MVWTLPAESNAELKAALEMPPVAGKIMVFKLWDLQGKLVFTSNGTLSNAEHFPADEIENSGPSRGGNAYRGD